MSHRPSWLALLVGPRDPVIDCDECFAALDRQAELELSRVSGGIEAGTDAPAEAVPGMRAHLASCPVCAEECESLIALLRAQDAS